MITEQQIFDRVATHLLTQNEKAINRFGVCRYRSDSGLTCAAGCLIKDEFYDPTLENKTSHTGPVSEAIAKSLEVKAEDLPHSLIRDLQLIHDSEDSEPDCWADDLRRLAKQRGLSHEVVDNFKRES